jgi:hypothetical protein
VDSTADPDYYGWSIGDTAEWKDLLPNFWKEGLMETGYEGGITIPLSEIQEKPGFKNHMKSLLVFEQQNNLTALEDSTGLDLSEAKQNPNEALAILTDIINDPSISDDNTNEVSNFLSNAMANKHPITGGTPMFQYSEDGESITFNYMPQVDEGIFGKDMTIDPQFTSKGDMSLPGLGVWGMRDGELQQVAASTLRPLDEMLMEDSPGADWVKENITDKIAWQGPAMHQPEGTGMSYQIPMWLGLARGATGVGKGIMGAGKMAYRYPKTTAGVGIPSAIFGKKLFASDEE